jgi:hypothetical protein
MSSGHSRTPHPKKLGIKEGHQVATTGAPDHFPDLLAPLHPSVSMRTDLRARGTFDVLVVFVRSERELRERFDRARDRLSPSGGLWVAWPKQSSPLATDLRESHVRSYGLSTGLVDNKICAIDEDWSGLRFVVRLEDRPKHPR